MLAEPSPAETEYLPSQTLPSPASGIRRRQAGVTDPVPEHVPSGWQLSAVLSWLLVLGVLGVLTSKFGAWMTWLDYGLQIALIFAVLMRLAWDARVHWLFGGVALVFVGLRLGIVLADRAEYQPDLDRFESTPVDPNPRAPPSE